MVTTADSTTEESVVAAPPRESAITLERVVKAYRSGSDTVRAVGGVDLKILKGEFFSLLGPSGCGKTTTMRMIAGFEDPTEGVVRLSGKDVNGVPANQRDVNMVFQSYALFPHMSVAANVAFGLERKRVPKKEIRSRVDAMLELVELGPRAKHRPAQLSGGQQQRVALARALVNEPGALLLDEPLGALDLKLRQSMQVELKRIQREVGITFVYVTHDQGEALTMSDRVAVMNNGLVEQLGTPAEIYERPATRFVADFIGTSNLLSGIVRERDPSGHHRVDLGRGLVTLVAELPAGVAEGSETHLTVRPEKVRIDTERPEGASPILGSPVPKQQGAKRQEAKGQGPAQGSKQKGHKHPETEGPGAEGDLCVLPGTVAETVYMGAATQYQVVLDSGAEITVYQQNSADSALVAERGDAVWLSWSPRHSYALPT